MFQGFPYSAGFIFIPLILIIQNIICIVNQFTIDRILESSSVFVALCCNHSRFLLFLTPFFYVSFIICQKICDVEKRPAKRQNFISNNCSFHTAIHYFSFTKSSFYVFVLTLYMSEYPKRLFALSMF